MPLPSSQRWMMLLGLASWVPFAVALYLIFMGEDGEVTLPMIISYGAAVLMFLAGVRFGSGLLSGNKVHWPVRVAPLMAGFGFAAMWTPAQVGLALLVVGFAGQGALDVWAGTIGRLPQPYVAARVIMTWLCVLTLIAILVLGGRA